MTSVFVLIKCTGSVLTMQCGIVKTGSLSANAHIPMLAWRHGVIGTAFGIAGTSSLGRHPTLQRYHPP